MDEYFKEYIDRVTAAQDALAKLQSAMDENNQKNGSIDDLREALDMKVQKPVLEGPTPLADTPAGAQNEEKYKTITKSNQFEQEISKQLEDLLGG